MDSMTKHCICGCSEETKGGDFRPGHDARYKSALVNSALDGDQAALDELEHRNWTKFLEKARANRTSTPRSSRPADSDETGGDGLPMNATRPSCDTDSFVRAICSGRQVVIRRTRTGYEETLRFRNPFEIAVPNKDGSTYRMKPCEPEVYPLREDSMVLELTCAETGGRRSIPIAEVVGVLNR